ncbi:M20/M25/M40 family metallo-hydrolase [Oceanobacillus saliphilus]|uniref:M20/M25/M40 family metallo-hydrolase n=1 Tax=Oceanobacillus saliphilus TaxID=2925834 RepID=UPI00201D874E|nr:M20/M25/M40 family metallo-hydrolase [Oceanobacillus saliphilus]
MRLPIVKETYKKLMDDERIKYAFEMMKSDHEKTVADQITITEIPAPPFKESTRAEYYRQRLIDLDLEDVQMDAEGNVFGIIPGTGTGPKLFVSAHLDTVFPEGTDTTVKEKDGILYAPGIGDDTRGLAEVLSIIRALKSSQVPNIGDIIIGGTVGEEGAGNLRGVKAFFHNHKVDGYISIDGPNMNAITYLGTGSYRYKITYKGPGGHSFADFGSPSAIHGLGRAIAEIAELQTKEYPKTTFSVGEVKGGSSVNAIAEEASMTVDLRSNNQQELADLDQLFLDIVKKACRDENNRWGSDQLTVEIERFGNRPSAHQSENDSIVQTAWAAIESAGGTPRLAGPSSTDANYPMSLGIPAITTGTGGRAGGAHTLAEWYDPENGYMAVQKSVMLILGLVGVKDVCDPLLSVMSEN